MKKEAAANAVKTTKKTTKKSPAKKALKPVAKRVAKVMTVDDNLKKQKFCSVFFLWLQSDTVA